MRSLYFLVPGTTKDFFCGGLLAEMKTCELAKKLQPSHLVTYKQREDEHLFLADILETSDHQNAIFIICWGPNIVELVEQLKKSNVIYHAHSTGYGFSLPCSIPIWTVSRNSMGYWGQAAPNNPIFYLPNLISANFKNDNSLRDIDVLVQTRKTSSYVLKQLIPELEKHCRVEVLATIVPDLNSFFNRAKIYLYDSSEHWFKRGVSEGFGLPPLEAMACGCKVFSSVNGALADYLDPSFNCEKISTYCVEYDSLRILKAVDVFDEKMDYSELLKEYSEEVVLTKLEKILQEVNLFFDYKQKYPPNNSFQLKVSSPIKKSLRSKCKSLIRNLLARFKR